MINSGVELAGRGEGVMKLDNSDGRAALHCI